MLETDLDIALSQGKTIDAREFAQQLILRGQLFRLAFMDGILIHVFLKSESYDESL